MKSLKHVKLFESFINEEYTQSVKMVQNLLMIQSEMMKALDLPDAEAKAKRGELFKEYEKVRAELEKFLMSTYDVKIQNTHSHNMGKDFTNFFIYFEIPEGFFTRVKRFFGFGLSKVQICYRVRNIDQLQYDVTGPGSYSISPEQMEQNRRVCEESVQLQLGSDRRNVFDDADKTLDAREDIELPEDAAETIINVIREINPSTSIRQTTQLVNLLNDDSFSQYQKELEYGKTDPNFKYVVANKVVLA
jgi:hypothetical protein